ncbi:constitutive coactivator of peroxisome proliferator-activated receptor gamma [Arapaima gigas]
MGVKGLQGFVENYSPDICIPVNLREMVESHRQANRSMPPTLVVDGMGCLRHWYRCKAWVHGGQWREYLYYLREFVGTFTEAGIRLVFFFDGVVEESKRAEWVKRRLRVNKEIAAVFRYIRAHRQQPGREMFCLPPGLATFSRVALKSMGQETWSTVCEADFEVASYARRHGCMGILGQDTDFLIFDSAPYLSIAKLRLDRMTTVLFSRERLCNILQLYSGDLPLLACILGNDVVSEHRMQRVRRDCMAQYHRSSPQSSALASKVFAVAEFVRQHHPHALSEGSRGLALLPFSDEDRALLEKGIRAYLLPGQESPWVKQDISSPSSSFLMEKYLSADIMQAAEEKHLKSENFMVYNVLHDGVVECSNTLEDAEDSQLKPQATLYRPVRERIYGVLLPVQTQTGSGITSPMVKEWFVSPINSLQEADIVYPSPLNLPGGHPDLKVLWFGANPDVKVHRIATFLAIFDLREMAESIDHLDTSLIAVVCLVTYLALQDSHLCFEDLDAFLSQAVCLRFKTDTELLYTKVHYVDPRAVQLGSLFVRGLSILAAANSTCGTPFLMDDLMPWKTFDGLLFHSKYLLAHSKRPEEELLEGNASQLPLFQYLREVVLGVCRGRGKVIPTKAQAAMAGFGKQPRRPKGQRYRLAPRWLAPASESPSQLPLTLHPHLEPKGPPQRSQGQAAKPLTPGAICRGTTAAVVWSRLPSIHLWFRELLFMFVSGTGPRFILAAIVDELAQNIQD